MTPLLKTTQTTQAKMTKTQWAKIPQTKKGIRKGMITRTMQEKMTLRA